MLGDSECSELTVVGCGDLMGKEYFDLSLVGMGGGWVRERTDRSELLSALV